MMLCSSMNHSRYTPPSRIYESLRISFSKAQSQSQTGKGNSQYGTTWVFHDLFGPKKIDKTKLVEYLDQGWYKGRVLRKCKTAQAKEKPEKYPHLAEWYKIYSAVGFDAFVEKTGYNYSQPNLVKLFQRHVKEFVPQNGKKRGNDLNGNSGYCWIMNPESGESKQIKKDAIIPYGWVKGRKIKNVS